MQKTVISEKRIRKKVRELAGAICRDFPTEVFVVCVLKGAAVFYADLIREISRQAGPKVFSNYIRASSYKGKESCGEVDLISDLDVRGKEVLVVEDIIDTGRTLSKVREQFMSQGAKAVKICTLLDKPSKRAEKISADYVGFIVKDLFLVGYGLDCNEEWRELPFIAEL